MSLRLSFGEAAEGARERRELKAGNGAVCTRPPEICSCAAHALVSNTAPGPHPDQNTEQQELSVGTRQPPRRRLFPRDTGEGGACSP